LTVGVPYWFEEGVEARCALQAEGIQERALDIRGIDPIDALRNAVGLVDSLLTAAQSDSDLFWPDGEPFEI
jgi:hypothetical protein